MTCDRECFSCGIKLVTFRCNPQIKSAVELRGIIIMNPASGRTDFLGYPHAAVWDLVSRDYSFCRIIKIISAITTLDELEGEKLVFECLNEWIEAGYLTREVGIG